MTFLKNTKQNYLIEEKIHIMMRVKSQNRWQFKMCEFDLLLFGITLASGSDDNFRVYGMLRQDNKMPNQMVIQVMLIQIVNILIVLHQHLVVGISRSVSGMLRKDNKSCLQMLDIKIFQTFNNLNYILPESATSDMTILKIPRIHKQKLSEHQY
ncbi:unnamed protein product [Paramecium octaurelia]|uniref:Uncharacterized protein n=1 Tax=Paramecium octaurelia TaxID=43137 RepID=A0A8S1SJA6_PAROT|nr:unnamed protein product [Paramecium octaurelia]